jgi:molecular chaperone GrpE
MSDVKNPSNALDIDAEALVKEALSSMERREKAARAQTEVDLEIVAIPVPEDAPPPSGDDPAAPAPGEAPVAVEIAAPVAPAAPAVAPPPPPPPRRTPQDAIIEALLKGKQEMAEALKQTQREAKDLLEARTRLQAEFENFKKRVNRDKQDAGVALTQKIMRDVLPVADNLERALAAVDESGNLAPETRNLLTGIKMVGKQMTDALRKAGVSPFQSQGQPFDPSRHEAVAQVPATGDQVPGTVVEEHQKGYLVGDVLLRPALVVVAGPRG